MPVNLMNNKRQNSPTVEYYSPTKRNRVLTDAMTGEKAICYVTCVTCPESHRNRKWRGVQEVEPDGGKGVLT